MFVLAAIAARTPTQPVITATALSSSAISIALTTKSVEPISLVSFYKLFRSIAGAPFTLLQDVSPGAFPFTDSSGLPANTAVSYFAEAVNGSPNQDASTPSLTTTATTQSGVGPTPTQPQIMATAISSSSITVALTTASTEPVNGIKDYVLQRSVGGNAFNTITTLTPAQWPYQDTGLTASTAYRYQTFSQDNVAALTPSQTSAITSATTQASQASPSLLTYLKSLPGKAQHILIGQHTDYYNANPNSVFDGGTSAANFTIGGVIPAIIGTTVQVSANGGAPSEPQFTDARGVVPLSNAWIAAGGIVQCYASFNNPAGPTPFGSGDGGYDTTDNPFPAILTPGSAVYNTWLQNLDQIAVLLAQIKGEFIFRPFAEMNGGWVWFGKGGTVSFVQLWRQVYNYFTITKGIKNMLWVYNVNAGVGNYAGDGNGNGGYYPGASYVDLCSMDSYPPSANDAAMYNALVALGHPVYYSEVGGPTPSNPPVNTFNNDTILNTVKANFPQVIGLVYFCQNFALIHQSGEAAVMTDPAIISRPQISVAQPPAPAAAVGYNTLTFNSIGLNTDATPGPWFPNNKLGTGTVTNTYTNRNADGSLGLSYGGTCPGPTCGGSSGAQLTAFNPGLTAAQPGGPTTTGPNGWRGDNGGKAFGGGAYFEIYVTLANGYGPPYANGGFAFWAETIEWMSGGGQTKYPVCWPANATWAAAHAYNAGTAYTLGTLVAYNGYVWKCEANTTGNAPPPSLATYNNAWWAQYQQHIELDFCEMDAGIAAGVPNFQNGAGNWTIDNASTHSPIRGNGVAGSVPVIPANADLTKPHYIGCLWKVATPTSQGYIEFYFDRQITALGRYSYNYWNPANPPDPPAAPWNADNTTTGGLALSFQDQQHFALLLGGDNNHPATIYSVQVWQTSDANNITS